MTVATSDGLEQLIVWGQGARRLSAADFWEEVCNTNEAIRNHLNNVNGRTQVCQMKFYLTAECQDANCVELSSDNLEGSMLRSG